MNRHALVFLRRAIAALPAIPALARAPLTTAPMLVPCHDPANHMRYTAQLIATVQCFNSLPGAPSHQSAINRNPKNP